MLLEIFYTVFGLPFLAGCVASEKGRQNRIDKIDKKYVDREQRARECAAALTPTPETRAYVNSHRILRTSISEYPNAQWLPYHLPTVEEQKAELQKTYDELKDDLVYIFTEQEFDRRFNVNSPEFDEICKNDKQHDWQHFSPTYSDWIWIEELLYAKRGSLREELVKDIDHKTFQWGRFDILSYEKTPSIEKVKARLRLLERQEFYLQQAHPDLDLTYYLSCPLFTPRPDPMYFYSASSDTSGKSLQVMFGAVADNSIKRDNNCRLDYMVKYYYQPDGYKQMRAINEALQKEGRIFRR